MKQSPSNYFVIVPAAGVGTRMKSDIPKQYLSVKGKCILEYTLNTLLNYSAFEKCVVVINARDKNWPSIKLNHPKLITTTGGNERANSVFNGLVALKPFIKENDWVLVHDAVRPFLHSSDIDKLISEIGDDPLGGLLGSPLKNTIKRIEDKHCLETLDRQKLWQALTPQMFRYHWLFKALNSAVEKQQTITDESNAIELLGKHPKIIEGRSDNIKITDSYDLAFFDYCLHTRQDLLSF
ncbi:2-C-methyl-D-erythritol 4-phosphate cytidylyltransferase [Rickettsiella endosymbiont of Dermanyssus gallinae]|uniref:2-C-methyl-D-erythritol 4-phosphate cytidylyltransferase n=1 Tax=Rickettsiella endosymbiont of Dermanyssus gallinae TaxID=2856608 RepID=UPI001C5307AA|nr:2-C-methyl-D-erythritol 4-phosphate cytidylyltransferase [Rickettsiella endosymbiont of Dermanyssus gallinae]